MRLMFIFLFFSALSWNLSAQNTRFLINGMNTHIAAYHLDNRLSLNYPEIKKLRIEAKRASVSRNKQDNTFNLEFSYTTDTKLSLVSVFDDKTLVDSFYLEVRQMSFKQFVRCEGIGLIKEGTHSKEVLQKMQSVEMVWNIPWLKGEVSSFDLEIYSERGEILYSKSSVSNNFNDAEIQVALAQLKPGSRLYIQRVMGKTPYDDGRRPENMTFICK